MNYRGRLCQVRCTIFSFYGVCFSFLNSYVPGDFILHFAGKKGRVRLELVESYYPEAEKVMVFLFLRAARKIRGIFKLR